jgi:hypothetical protein
MANLDAPRGFTPVKYRSGKPYSGIARRYYKSATAGIIGVGDPVIRATNSSDPDGGPEIVRATTGAAITGVVVAIEPKESDLEQVGYLASADTGYVLVADDPDLLFEVQEVSGGTALAVVNIGEHIDSVAAIDADTTIGRSKYEIDNAALATDNTWRLEALVNRPNNAVGEHAKWLVSANLHTEVNASATNLTEI